MAKMDWNDHAYRYTVGAGNKKIDIMRLGENVIISGGEISTSVRFDDYEKEQGWHTESGNYTFRNVRFTREFVIRAENGENYTITLDSSTSTTGQYGIHACLCNGANLNLINNIIIHSDSSPSISVSIDDDCHMTITGNGKMLCGYGDDENLDMIPMPISIGVGILASNNTEAIEKIRLFEGNVVISRDQIKMTDDYLPIYNGFIYSSSREGLYEDVINPLTDEPYRVDASYFLRKIKPDKGVMLEPVLSSKSELVESSLYRPLLVTHQTDNHILYLQSEIVREKKGELIEYEINLINENDEKSILAEKSDLYIPYPEGMDNNNAANYEVTILHTMSDMEESFSTMNGSLELTPYGFCISVSSLGSFEITWKEQPKVDLPQTGDNSHIALWIVLLTLAGTAILILKRKNA